MANNIGLEIFEYLLEYGVIFVIINCIWKVKLTQSGKRWAIAGISFALSVFLAEYLLTEIDVVIFCLSQILTVFFLFEEKWGRKAALYFLCFIYPSFLSSYVQLIMMWIFHLTYEQIIETDWYSMMGYVPVYSVIIVVGILGCNSRPLKHLKELPDKYLWILNVSGLFAAIAISALCGIVDMFSGFTRNFLTFAIITSSLIFLLLVAGFVIADILREKYENEIQMKDKYTELIKKHYKLLLDKDEETRKIRHDIKSHMMMLNEYADKNDFVSLKRYLEEMNQDYQRLNRNFVYTGNRTADAIIGNMESKAKLCGVNMKVRGKLPQIMDISDYDLCTVLSNLILNAIEASEKILKTDREVIVTVKHLQSYMVIEVENPMERQVDIEKIIGNTGKKDRNSHGYGLLNVRETVEKYHGDLKFECEGGIFRAKVMFCDINL